MKFNLISILFISTIQSITTSVNRFQRMYPTNTFLEKLQARSLLQSSANNGSLENITNLPCVQDFYHVCGISRRSSLFRQWLKNKYGGYISINETDPCWLRRECFAFCQHVWNNSIERLVTNKLKQWIKPSIQIGNMCVLVLLLYPTVCKLNKSQPLVSSWFYLKSVFAVALTYHALTDIPNIVVRLLLIGTANRTIEQYSELDNLGHVPCCFISFLKSTLRHYQNWTLLLSMWDVLFRFRAQRMKQFHRNFSNGEVSMPATALSNLQKTVTTFTLSGNSIHFRILFSCFF